MYYCFFNFCSNDYATVTQKQYDEPLNAQKFTDELDFGAPVFPEIKQEVCNYKQFFKFTFHARPILKRRERKVLDSMHFALCPQLAGSLSTH